MTNRQARIKRLKEAFQKAEELMNEGYVVQWDGDVVVGLRWDYGLELDHGDWCYTGIYEDSGEFEDMADMKISEINKELLERLTIWKKVEVKV